MLNLGRNIIKYSKFKNNWREVIENSTAILTRASLLYFFIQEFANAYKYQRHNYKSNSDAC